MTSPEYQPQRCSTAVLPRQDLKDIRRPKLTQELIDQNEQLILADDNRPNSTALSEDSF